MQREFTVERVAMHLVDGKLPGPRFSPREIDLKAFKKPADLEAVQAFFFGHLSGLWDAPESRRTRAARFAKTSQMKQHYEDLQGDPGQFFPQTRAMAQLLYDVSKGLRTSPGLLMVLWVRLANDQPNKQRSFLVLLKMDPSRSDKIALRRDEAGNILLNLAVQHIDQALPDPGERILKWAVIPHPTRPTFDVKLRDAQGEADPSQYFMDFLGCEMGFSEKQQTRGLLEALPTYAEEHHPEEEWEEGVRELLEELETEPGITAETVVKKIRELKVFDGFQEKAFREKLTGMGGEALYISPDTLRDAKLEYRLSGGIVIKGPRAAMENRVQIISLNGEQEIRIRTAGVEKRYV